MIQGLLPGRFARSGSFFTLCGAEDAEQKIDREIIIKIAR